MTGSAKGNASSDSPEPGSVSSMIQELSLEELEPEDAGATGAQPEGGAAALSGVTGMVGNSPAMQRVFQLLRVVAKTATTVLITGESGTGKELVARALHRHSPRAKKTMVAINCGAIPEHLLEDELFGHVKGAYTDARESRTGKFEQAQQGTLFLDEIGSMPLALQSKLLRVIEQREVERLGSNDTIKLDVRFVAATNSDLREKVREGLFREDLFYRLHVVPVHLPPLRHRRGDVALLVNHFLQLFCNEYGLPPKKVDPGSLRRLTHHTWPGNVRELRNAVEFATVLSGERTTLAFEDFPALIGDLELGGTSILGNVALPEGGLDLNRVLAELEKTLIYQSLDRTAGNKGKAARLLALKRTTLVEKLRRIKMAEAAAQEASAEMSA